MKKLMKNKFKITVGATMFLCLMVSSCQQALDTAPLDTISPEFYYENEDQLKTALAGVYGIMTDTRSEEPLYAAAYISSMGTEGDDGYYRKGPERNIVGQFFYNASTPAISHLWEYLYKGINLANTLLERIDGAEIEDQKREIIRGEALFLRSYYYFLLVSNWGDVPLILESTKSAYNHQIARTPSKEVYEQITADMQKAYDLVETATEVGHGGRVNKSAVAGILARVYLYWAGYPLRNKAKYEDARTWALKVMQSDQHQLAPSFSQIFINYAQDKYNVKESIWEVEFAGNRTDRPRQAGLVGNYIGIRSTNDQIGNSNANVRAAARLYRLYGDGDKRRDWSIAPFEYIPIESTTRVNYDAANIWNRYAGKYRREYETVLPKSKGYTPINYPLLRYADVLLMFAEADNEFMGRPTPEAIDAVNEVRRRGYEVPLDVANPISDLGAEDTVDKFSFLQAIQDERSRELNFESLRRNDLIRWGIYLYSMKALATDYEQGSGVPSNALTVVPSLKYVNTKHLFWPIPTRELTVNKLLVQNPGW
ncbi:RagB/SusD family nutrient uptake outer membrane protein [Desertivirga xinjiangensis]|uniref:RagB/SusD family nutrient uptake outer membrane protein n=1 Tax=Desertivirga xinjiangensis TaxID=539206 RepID=UPI00210BF5C8|nr:RagB/SusD family nutrient uptake outer membrane protein [Pedobacter xinjiangensis]